MIGPSLALVLGFSPPEVRVVLEQPAPAFEPTAARRVPEGRTNLVLDFRADTPTPPPTDTLAPVSTDQPLRALGTPTTLFVNFDGVKIGECSPSNSKKNCHWLNEGVTFEPFSGSMQKKVAILQTMRAIVHDYGIRVTGTRPSSDESYAMVVYGGEATDFEALGQAPSGDCGDQRPNEIAFAYLDGDWAHWVNGGATTALHEAAHTWGLDHVDDVQTVMAPFGDNSRVYFAQACNGIVSNPDLEPGEGSCPSVNLEHCDDENEQRDGDTLVELFGPPFVDEGAPLIHLVEPRGLYVQAPGDFLVEIDIQDELDPQVYELMIEIEGLYADTEPRVAYDADFEVNGLPLGVHTFHLSLRDEAGNEGTLSFDIEVGEDPPPELEDGRGCAISRPARSIGWLALVVVCAARRRPRGERAHGRVESCLARQR